MKKRTLLFSSLRALGGQGKSIRFLTAGIFFLALLAVPKIPAQSLIETITIPDSNIFLGMELYQPGGKLFLLDYNYPRVLVYDSNTFGFLKEISFSSYSPLEPWSITIDKTNGILYVALLKDNWFTFDPSTVLVMDANTYALKKTISVSTSGGLTVDESRGRLYMCSRDYLTAIDLASSTEVGTLDLYDAMGGGLPSGRDYNAVTGEWVFGNLHYDKFMVIDGLSMTPEVISVPGSRGWTACWNSLENKIYVTTITWSGYFIYDRDTDAYQICPSDNDGTDLYFSQATNRAYTSAEINEDTTVIDGATDSCQNIAMPEGALMYVKFVDARHHAIYFSEPDPHIFVLDEDKLKISKSFLDNGSGYYSDSAVDQVNQRVFAEFVDYTQNLSYILVFDYHEPSLTLMSPDGGENWEAGSTHNITWKDTGTIANVKLEYSIDNGSTWTTIVDSTPNTYTYSWTLPNLGSATCLVRISDVADGLVYDVSDAVFSILFPLGEALDNTSLTWETGGDADWRGESLVYYYGGSAAQSDPIDYEESTYIQTTVSGPGDLSFFWKVKSVQYYDYLSFLIDDVEKTKISGDEDWEQVQYPISAGLHVLKWKYSKVSFWSSDPDAAWLDKVEYTVLPVAPFKITSPNGGESWTAGSTHNITWSTVGSIPNVKIEYSKDSGSNYATIIASTSNSGSYPWIVPLTASSNCLVKISDVINPGLFDVSDGLFTITPPIAQRDDFVGTWDGKGVYYRNSNSGAWVKMAGPATLIAVGDLYGDAIDDLIGIWPTPGGIWVRNSANGSWTKLSSSARHIATGDMNGDARVDLLGTWDGAGVFYRNSISGSWAKLATPASLVTAGDLDGDTKDDLIGLWPAQGGVWVKYSLNGAWAKLSSTARDMAAGDMNGDGRDDFLGTYDGKGVYYRDSFTGVWVKMATPAEQVTCGDMDNDGKDDLIGLWPAQGGVWVKYSKTGTWSKLSSVATDIASGKMRAAGGIPSEVKSSTLASLPGLLNGQPENMVFGPENILEFKDLSAEGPGGLKFGYWEDKDFEQKESDEMRAMRTPGPGEPGFRWVEQKNLFPQEKIKTERANSRAEGQRKKVTK